MSCDVPVGEVTERLENEQSSYLCYYRAVYNIFYGTQRQAGLVSVLAVPDERDLLQLQATVSLSLSVPAFKEAAIWSHCNWFLLFSCLSALDYDTRGWVLSFPNICLITEEKPWKKPQPGKQTWPGIQPRPARWEAMMLPPWVACQVN